MLGLTLRAEFQTSQMRDPQIHLTNCVGTSDAKILDIIHQSARRAHRRAGARRALPPKTDAEVLCRLR